MQCEEVMVSVLCVAFNHQKYIRRCLDSIVGQKTSFKYEIIIHDDASSDGTQDIIREYSERFPNLIIPILQEENQYSKGKDIVKNYLFPKASGKYIVECECDDYWCDENKLQRQVDILEKHKECVLCVHATNSVDAEGSEMDLHFPMMKIEEGIITTREFMDMTLDENSWPFHLSAFMVKKQLFEEYMDFKTTGFPSKFFRVGDLPLYLYFGLKGATYYIDRVMTTYTMESGGFMSRVKADPQFAYKVSEGFVRGLTDFDEYSNHEYSAYVQRMLVPKRFEIARIERRFDVLVSTPEFRRLVKKRVIFKRTVIYVVGYTMLLIGKCIKKG